MQTFVYTMQGSNGIHVRPAGELARLAKGWKSKVTLSANGRQEDAEQMIRVLQMDIRSGDQITVCASGPDEEAAIQSLITFFSQSL